MLLALGFGSGLSPRAPGTAGSVLGALLYLPFYTMPNGLALALILIAAPLGVWICHRAAQRLGVHDHPGIVWDEFVGVWMVLYCMPPGWLGFVIALVAFRLFDILKPWPISWLDRRVHGGLGIMLDDIVAALFAILAGWLFLWAISL